MTLCKRFMPLCLAFCAVIILAPLGQRVAADSALQLSAVQAGDFHQALTVLAEQGHVALVAEGAPLHPQLSPQDAANLSAPAVLDDVVKAVAAAYDYSAQRMGAVFVLKKRYTDPNDLPALTQAECERVFALLPQVAEPFNPHGLSSHIQYLAPQGPQLRRDQVRILHPLIDAFAASLTPDQLVAMHQNKPPDFSLFVKMTPDQRAALLKKNYLLISSLSESQKTMARKLNLSLYQKCA